MGYPLTKRLIGQILVDGEFVTRYDLQPALEEQRHTNEMLGEVLVRLGLIDPTDLKMVLSVQRDFASLRDSIMAAAGVRQLLGDLLLRARRVTPEQIESALSEQLGTNEKLGEVLVRLGLITENELVAVLAFQQCQGGEAPSSDPLRLGEILVAANHITREQLEDAIGRQRISKKRIGEVLVEAGYAEPHQIESALNLQRKLVTAALIAALSLASVKDVDAARPTPSGSAAITVTATVEARSIIKVVRQPSEVVVTNNDTLRGYVDVPEPSRIEIRSNSRSGYLLSFEGLGEPFKEVHISGLGRDVQITSGNGWIARPYSRGTVTAEISYRFILSEGAQPGSYAWPLTISVIPQ